MSGSLGGSSFQRLRCCLGSAIGDESDAYMLGVSFLPSVLSFLSGAIDRIVTQPVSENSNLCSSYVTKHLYL